MKSKGQDEIVSTPDTCGGAWRIKDTRISVDTLQYHFARGDTNAEIRKSYPHLTNRGLDMARRWAWANGDALIAEQRRWGKPLRGFRVFCPACRGTGGAHRRCRTCDGYGCRTYVGAGRWRMGS